MQSMLRLYEVTQEELTMQDRFWQSNYTAPLRSWFEDRAGLYQWGVGGVPSTTFPVELLCAVRDDDALTMLSGFLCSRRGAARRQISRTRLRMGQGRREFSAADG